MRHRVPPTCSSTARTSTRPWGTSILGRAPPRGAAEVGAPAPVRPGAVGPAGPRPVLPRRQHRAADDVRAGAARDRLHAGAAVRRPGEKVVDIAIQRTLVALRDREDDVLLVSNDGDFVEAGRRPGSTAGRGRRGSGSSSSATARSSPLRGARAGDRSTSSTTCRAFNERLPRVRIIPIDEFDPAQFL